MTNIKSTAWRKGLILSATFLLGIFLIISCKKKQSPIGQSTIDQTELLSSGGIDTFSLRTFTIVEDSVITDNPAYGILGAINDPVFGTTVSEIYTQLRLIGVDPNFGDPKGITVDSLVLRLEYAGFYGKPGYHAVEVYELAEDLYIDSTYYASTTFTDKGVDLVQFNENVIYFDENTLTVISDDTVSSQLRIPMNISLGEELIKEAYYTPVTFNTNTDFISYFKGLKIRIPTIPPSGDGGLFYFDMNDPSSKMTLYYTDADGQHEFDFVINSECADFNHVDVNNAFTNVQNVIDDTLSGMTEFYAQSFKSRAVVQIPGLSDIPSNAVIHKATLELPVEYQSGTSYDPGDLLIASTRIEKGDDKLYSIGVLGEYSDANKQFTFDLRSYVQSIVSGQLENTELVFSPFFFITSGDRIIFNGPQTNNKMKPKISIVYTEF